MSESPIVLALQVPEHVLNEVSNRAAGHALARMDERLGAATPWLLLKEAATYMRMAENTLRDHMRRGEVPVHRKGKRTRFYRPQLDAWLAGLPIPEVGGSPPPALPSPPEAAAA